MRLQFIISETFKGLTRNFAMTVSVILVSFVSLLFVGASALLQVQIDQLKGDWYDKVEVSVFMCPRASSSPACAEGEATQEQIDAVEGIINSEVLAPYIKSYEFESKAEAYANFMKVFHDQPIGRNATERTCRSPSASSWSTPSSTRSSPSGSATSRASIGWLISRTPSSRCSS